MNLIRRIPPEWALRIGLGTMFLYSGIDIFRHPKSWTWAVPTWFLRMIEVGVGLPIEAYMQAQAVSELEASAWTADQERLEASRELAETVVGEHASVKLRRGAPLDHRGPGREVGRTRSPIVLHCS